jgi:thiamine pyrophosphate-dependent acetolactate synthase large subunit-like protein
LRIDSAEGLPEKLTYFLEHEGPIVLNVITDSSESVLPMVSPGKAIDDMILEESGGGFQGDAPC